jgi:hypothetical protein
LRARKQAELEEYERRYTGDAAQDEQRINAETEAKIQEIRRVFNENRAAVVKKVLDAVTTVTLRVHPNVSLS